MKRCFSRIVMLLLSVVWIWQITVPAGALQTYQPVETDRKCSMQLIYRSGERYYEGLEIQLFHVAEVSSETQYTLTDVFRSYPVNINAVSSQTEWDSVASTLTAYVIGDNILPVQEKKTDKNGVVRFSGLQTGLYLVRWTKNQTKDNVTGFEPFMMAVPNLSDDGNWEYDIVSYPKPGQNTEPTGKEIEYKAVILWNDAGFEKQRPENVQIEVFRNGESVEKYSVSAKDNWTCRWKAVDDGTQWTVVEHISGKKYDVTVSKFGNVFTIVNYYKESIQPSGTGQQGSVTYPDTNPQPVRSSDESDHPRPIQTGDNHTIVYCIAIICMVSGVLSMIIAVYGRRSDNEK